MSAAAISVLGGALIGMLLLPILKEHAKGFFLPASLLLSCAMLSAIWKMAQGLLVDGQALLALADTEAFSCIGKSLLIGIGSDCASHSARDGGMSALAYKIELFGKISILILCIPLALDLITWVYGVFE